MKPLTLLIILAVLLLYIVVGGVIFRALEQNNEVTTRISTTALISKFLSEHPCISREELENVLTATLEAYKSGVIATDNTTDGNTWSLHNAVFFSVTVITTIGYGNLSPSTTAGQGFCIFFAVFGIPLTFVFLGEIGNMISKHTKKAAKKIRYLHDRPKGLRLVQGLFLFVSGLVLFVLVPAIIFTFLEDDWTYGHSIYYAVISLTTIGFGDYVAGQDVKQNQQWYRICLVAWIIIGLSWMATVLSAVQDSYTKLVLKSQEDTGDQERLPNGHTPTSEEKVNNYLERNTMVVGDTPITYYLDNLDDSKNTAASLNNARLEQMTYM